MDVTFSEHRLIDEESHFPEMITDHHLELSTVQQSSLFKISLTLSSLSILSSCRSLSLSVRLKAGKRQSNTFSIYFITHIIKKLHRKRKVWDLSFICIGIWKEKNRLAYKLVWQGSDSGAKLSSKPPQPVKYSDLYTCCT